MDRILRVGVIGCGEIAQIAHIPYLKELPGFEVGAICDISPQVVKGVGDRFGVKDRYLDFRDMVAQANLDAVIICNRDHAEPAICAMRAGLHVMVEKPLAFNLEQADQMIAVSKETNVKLMVAYMKRYDPAYERSLSLFKDIGDLHLIRVHNFGGTYTINRQIYDLVRPTDISRQDFESSLAKEREDMIQAIGTKRADLFDAFSQLMYNSSHDITVLEGAFGRPREILFSDVHDDFFVTAVLDYGDKTRCVWETGRVLDLVDWDEQITAYGSRGRVTIKFPFPYLKNAPTQILVNETEGDANIDRQIVSSFDEAFKREWHHFYSCVTEDREPLTNAEKARADIEFLASLIKRARP